MIPHNKENKKERKKDEQNSTKQNIRSRRLLNRIVLRLRAAPMGLA